MDKQLTHGDDTMTKVKKQPEALTVKFAKHVLVVCEKNGLGDCTRAKEMREYIRNQPR